MIISYLLKTHYYIISDSRIKKRLSGLVVLETFSTLSTRSKKEAENRIVSHI